LKDLINPNVMKRILILAMLANKKYI